MNLFAPTNIETPQAIALVLSLCCCVLHAQEPQPPLDRAGNDKVAEIMQQFAPRGVQSDGSQPTAPQAALETFQMRDGFAMELVASEPSISQPLFLSWDSRGRLWVVQYRQYQYPAGLKVVRFDQHLRAIFDKVPEPPPNHARGKDRITVFEDTDGDGSFDTHRDVITGLNIASSVALGRGGIWVLNPPYLLFYPDADRDDVPDGDPEVHLSGFGLQDTHSVANSLMWGPDGWLYGANGSTTGGTVSSENTPGISFQGQCIWRYDPATKIFEIYAEGGGNTFSLDIDASGQVLSGTNGGNTRGWHYPQGSYSRKNWGKHGPLTNPFAFGFFEAMPMQGDTRRFAQAFTIYDSDLFPEEFRGSIIAPNSMQNLVWHSQRIANGSSYLTIDQDNLVESSDRWFRPVYAGVGPEGAVYVADWYDTRLSHVSPTDDWHKESGRIYRIVPNNVSAVYEHGDLHRKPARELVEHLRSRNKWLRWRSILELGWRSDLSDDVVQQLRLMAINEHQLDAVWALSNSGNLSSELAGKLLRSPNAHIRRWTIRLLGDRHESHPMLPTVAAREPDVRVRSQLAATARRVDATLGLKIVTGLLEHPSDAEDVHLPLMTWWAIESHLEQWNAIESFLKQPQIWSSPVMRKVCASRLIQSYATHASQESLRQCSEIVRIAPQEVHPQLVLGLNQAFQGRPLPVLPENLRSLLADYRESLGKDGIALAVRQGDQEKTREALALLRRSETELGLRIALIGALSESRIAEARPILLNLATRGTALPALQRAAIQSLVHYDESEIASRIARAFDGQISAEHDLRASGCRTLASRESWAKVLLGELKQWRLKPSDVPPDVIQRLRAYTAPEISQLVTEVFGPPPSVSSPDIAAEIQRLEQVLQPEVLQPSAISAESIRSGRALFAQHCGKCHRLFGQGERIGPELDNYDRKNLKFWLPAIVAPSLEIREGYQSYVALTEDDRLITGMISAQDSQRVTIRTADNKIITLQRDELLELKALPQSLMPADTLKPLSDQQVQDLFHYLRSTPEAATNLR